MNNKDSRVLLRMANRIYQQYFDELDCLIYEMDASDFEDEMYNFIADYMRNYEGDGEG